MSYALQQTATVWYQSCGQCERPCYEVRFFQQAAMIWHQCCRQSVLCRVTSYALQQTAVFGICAADRV